MVELIGLGAAIGAALFYGVWWWGRETGYAEGRENGRFQERRRGRDRRSNNVQWIRVDPTSGDAL